MATYTYTTLSDARTAYLANVSYRNGSGSVAMAEKFAAACRSLLVLQPSRSAQEGDLAEFPEHIIRDELATVEKWLDSNDSARSDASVKTVNVDLRQVRDTGS